MQDELERQDKQATQADKTSRQDRKTGQTGKQSRQGRRDKTADQDNQAIDNRTKA
jgi:hypothetical protein